jgi:hypothetical protein
MDLARVDINLEPTPFAQKTRKYFIVVQQALLVSFKRSSSNYIYFILFVSDLSFQDAHHFTS